MRKKSSSSEFWIADLCKCCHNVLMPLKVCTKCGEAKPATTEFFHKHPKSPDKLKPRCKSCRRHESRAYYTTNADRIKAYVKTHTLLNYRKSLDRRNAWSARKRASDPRMVLRIRISRSMRRSLIQGKSGASWESMVDFNLSELACHIERQFTKGMNWKRFLAGDIHIDHIRPVCGFNFSSPDDEGFKACWALTNLRPLWARDNYSKGGRRIFLV